MSQEIKTVFVSCGLTVGLNIAPPPPGPMTRKSPGRSAANVAPKHTNKRRALRRRGSFIGSCPDHYLSPGITLRVRRPKTLKLQKQSRNIVGDVAATALPE